MRIIRGLIIEGVDEGLDIEPFLPGKRLCDVVEELPVCLGTQTWQYCMYGNRKKYPFYQFFEMGGDI